MKIAKIMLAVIILMAGYAYPAKGQGSAETVTMDLKTVYCDLMESGPRRMRNAQLYVAAGDVDGIRKNLSESIIKNIKLQEVFSENDDISFVVFRGFCNSVGQTVRIEKVERAGSVFYVYAVYFGNARGIFVAQAFTYPAAFISMGRLPKGRYEAKLRVTRVVRDWKGGYIDTVQEKNKDRAGIVFEVK